MSMKRCPNCNENIVAIDTIGLFRFENKGSRVRWVLGFSFLILVWSALIPIFFSQPYRLVLLVIYYIFACGFLYRIYLNKLDSIVYGCENCSKKFIGRKLSIFTYTSSKLRK